MALEKQERRLDIPIPLREGWFVWVKNLPVDITYEEAKKIARTIVALAASTDPKPSSVPAPTLGNQSEASESGDALIREVARAMCNIESRMKASSLDDLARRQEQWPRFIHEAKRLLDELRMAGITANFAAVLNTPKPVPAPQGETTRLCYCDPGMCYLQQDGAELREGFRCKVHARTNASPVATEPAEPEGKAGDAAEKAELIQALKETRSAAFEYASLLRFGARYNETFDIIQRADAVLARSAAAPVSTGEPAEGEPK